MRRALIERAREFRARPTRSDTILWSALRRQSFGVRFYRQKVVGPFIPDFVAERPGLVVEIDGGVHDGLVERDAERQRWLEDRGYLVCRVTADAVEHRIAEDLSTIALAVADAGRRHPTHVALLVPAASSRE